MVVLLAELGQTVNLSLVLELSLQAQQNPPLQAQQILSVPQTRNSAPTVVLLNELHQNVNLCLVVKLPLLLPLLAPQRGAVAETLTSKHGLETSSITMESAILFWWTILASMEGWV